jgi:class 3 adenylate cyclase
MTTDKWNRIAKSPEAASLLKLALHINDICDHEGDISDFLPSLLHQLAQLLDVGSTAITVIDHENHHQILGKYNRLESEVADEILLTISNQTAEGNDLVTSVQGIKEIENVLSTPIKKSDRTLGCFILANKSNGDFNDYDNIVVTLVEAQMDYVIDAWIRKKNQLFVETENRVMKELDKIRDESEDQGKALDEMIKTILEAIGADIGFITLYDSEGDRHLPGGKVLQGNRPMSQSDYKQVGELIRKSKYEQTTIKYGKIPNSEIDSILIVPMFISGLFLGAIVLLNNKSHVTFSNQDKAFVESVAGIIDSFVFQEEKFKRLMKLVGREATRDVEEALMGHRPDTGTGKRMEITMLFADIRGYSSLTKDMDPTTTVRMLNDFFTTITPIIISNHGIVDKYMGDEIVALFTKSTAKGSHQLLAVNAAIAIQQELTRINHEWELTGRPKIEVGIGIHSGEVVLGQIGSFDRKDYTAVGSNMNFAARLQTVAGPGETIISEETYIGVTGQIMARRVGPFQIKGFGDKITYLVEGESPEQF